MLCLRYLISRLLVGLCALCIFLIYTIWARRHNVVCRTRRPSDRVVFPAVRCARGASSSIVLPRIHRDNTRRLCLNRKRSKTYVLALKGAFAGDGSHRGTRGIISASKNAIRLSNESAFAAVGSVDTGKTSLPQPGRGTAPRNLEAQPTDDALIRTASQVGMSVSRNAYLLAPAESFITDFFTVPDALCAFVAWLTIPS